MKTCVITGAASGIGEALVKQYLSAGFKVIGVDVQSNKDLEKLEFFELLLCDLMTEQGRAELLASFESSIDVFIHSAGINYVAAFAESDVLKQLRVLDLNLTAVILLSQALLRNDLLLAGSSFVFISSLSHQLSYPGASAYAASKDGLSSLARSLGVALSPKGIHCLTVFPGPTRTPHAREHSPDNSREEKRMAPELLASKIFKAQQQKRMSLIPSFGLRVFAAIGTYFPFITEKIMVETLYKKLEKR